MSLNAEEAKIAFPFMFDEKGNLHPGDKIPKYPHGLEIRLESIALKKMGLKSKDFELGQVMIIDAKIIIEKVVDEQVLGEDPEMVVKMQITDLAISEGVKKLEDHIYINS